MSQLCVQPSSPLVCVATTRWIQIRDYQKQEAMGHGVGGGGGEGALAVVAMVDAAMETDPQQVVGARMVGMPAELLDCHTCRLPLKPPIFKVRRIHVSFFADQLILFPSLDLAS
jgi:hypothetical protein